MFYVDYAEVKPVKILIQHLPVSEMYYPHVYIQFLFNLAINGQHSILSGEVSSENYFALIMGSDFFTFFIRIITVMFYMMKFCKYIMCDLHLVPDVHSSWPANTI